ATVRRYPFSPSLVFLFFLTCRRPPRPPLFPYTTLFRSSDGCTCPRSPQPNAAGAPSGASRDPRFARPWSCFGAGRCGGGGPGGRSEEHTAELQSPTQIGCRLLRCKKNSTHRKQHYAPWR